MNDLERQQLEYSPRLEFTKRLLAIISDTDVTESDIVNLPQALLDTVSLPAADVLQNLADTSKALDDLIDQLGQCLDGRLDSGISIADYRLARENDNYEIRDQFEDHYNNSPEASTAGEALIYLLDVKSNLDTHKAYVSNTFYNGKAQFDNIDKHRDDEQKEINKLVSLEIKKPGAQDYTSLKIQHNLLDASNDRINNVSSFVGNIKQVLTSGINQQFKDVTSVVRTMALGGPDNIGHVSDITEFRFKQLAFISDDNQNRSKRLNTESMRAMIDSDMKILSNLKTTTSSSLINWFSNTSTKNDTLPITKLFSDAISGLELVETSYQTRMADLSKTNALEKMQLDDIAASLEQKKEARQVYSLTKAMLDQFDFKDSNIDKQVKRFIDNNSLDTPGKICE